MKVYLLYADGELISINSSEELAWDACHDYQDKYGNQYKKYWVKEKEVDKDV